MDYKNCSTRSNDRTCANCSDLGIIFMNVIYVMKVFIVVLVVKGS